MNQKEFKRLLAEQRDDATQRPLHEKGVRYEDEAKTLRDILDIRSAALEPQPSMGKLHEIER